MPPKKRAREEAAPAEPAAAAARKPPLSDAALKTAIEACLAETGNAETGVYEPMTLRNDGEQMKHLMRLWRARREMKNEYEGMHRVLFDASEMGMGKTHIALALARVLKVAHVRIICPAALIKTWRDKASAYFPVHGVDFKFITFDKIRGTSVCGDAAHVATIDIKDPATGKMVEVVREAGDVKAFFSLSSNDLLIGVVKDSAGAAPAAKDVTNYVASAEMKKLAKAGLLLIVDEVHNAKNVESKNFRAVSALVNFIYTSDIRANTTALLLSGTLFSKMSHLVAMLRIMNVITTENEICGKVRREAHMGDDVPDRAQPSNVFLSMVRYIKNNIYRGGGPAQADFDQRTQFDSMWDCEKQALLLFATHILPAQGSYIYGVAQKVNAPGTYQRGTLKGLVESTRQGAGVAREIANGIVVPVNRGAPGIFDQTAPGPPREMNIANLFCPVPESPYPEASKYREYRDITALALYWKAIKSLVCIMEALSKRRNKRVRRIDPKEKPAAGVALAGAIAAAAADAGVGAAAGAAAVAHAGGVAVVQVVDDAVVEPSDNGIIGGLVVSLHLAEVAKVHVFVQLALEVLKKEPNASVVIALNYTDSLTMIADGIKKLAPPRNGKPEEVEIIQGSTDMTEGDGVPSERGQIIARFQNNTTRVLVANMHCIAHGLDLDDQSKEGTPEHPRRAFASPSFHTTDMHQFVRRFFRSSTRPKTSSSVRFVYGLPLSPGGEILHDTVEFQKKELPVTSASEYFSLERAQQAAADVFSTLHSSSNVYMSDVDEDIRFEPFPELVAL